MRQQGIDGARKPWTEDGNQLLHCWFELRSSMSQGTDSRRCSGTETGQKQCGNSARFNLLSPVWRATIQVTLTLAVIVGILAMHLFASPSPHAGSVTAGNSSTTSVASHHAVDVAAIGSDSDCVDCGDEASMTLMWCVLALLTVTLLLTAPKSTNGRSRQSSRLFSFSRLRPRFLGLVPRPPSLNVLCISRT